MPTPFPLLGDAQYMAYVGDLSHRGANPTTHLADIRYPVQSAPITSVVKLLDPGGLEACNEAIAWLFLRAAGVASPPNAAILTLSEAKAVKVLGRAAIGHDLSHNGFVLAWASSKLDFSSIRALFAGSDASDRLVATLQSVSGAAIAAFDEVFLNVDRNAGNVLFSSAQTAVAIDHEEIFARQDWRHASIADLATDGDSLRRLKAARASGRLRLQDFQEAMNRMPHAAERYSTALTACSMDIEQLLVRVYPAEGTVAAGRVLSFVTERTARNWIKDKLGVV